MASLKTAQLIAASSASYTQLLSLALVGGGLLGWGMFGFSYKAKPSLIVGCATGGLMLLCSLILKRPITSPSAASYVYGFRASVLLAAVFAAVFFWRARLTAGKPEYEKLGYVILGMSASSLLCLLSLLRVSSSSGGRND